jgi:hypothetical protein
MTRYRSGQVGDVVDQICGGLPAAELAKASSLALRKVALPKMETALRTQNQDCRASRERPCRDEQA